MLNTWRSLGYRTRTVLVLTVGFVILRTYIASLSGFGFHQGWNEAHYALLAEGFFKHPLIPRYGDLHVYNVPPLFPYLVSASFLVFGESELAARLPSIVATGGTILMVYGLGVSVYRDRTIALVGAAIFSILPYVQLYGGRAQTDAILVFFVSAAIFAIQQWYRTSKRNYYWLVAGGGFFSAAFATKQPALLVAGVVLVWLLGNWQFRTETIQRTVLLICASFVLLLPIVAWFYMNYVLAPAAFISDWEHELFSRTPPFDNVTLLIAIAFGLGLTPPVVATAAVGVLSELQNTIRELRRVGGTDRGPTILFWWVLLFGAFVFVRTPQGHQYYAVILTPPLALLSAVGIQRTARFIARIEEYRGETIFVVLVVLTLISCTAGTVVLFELSGEFSAANGGGSWVASDASNYLTESEIPDDATILVPKGYGPPIKWYVRDELRPEQIVPYQVSTFDQRRLHDTVEDSEGAVYLLYPEPSWGNMPSQNLIPLYESKTYDYSLMAVGGQHVQSRSKFTYYLDDRRILVYRVGNTTANS